MVEIMENDLLMMLRRMRAHRQPQSQSGGNDLHSLSGGIATAREATRNPTYGGAVLGPGAAAGMQQAGLQGAMQGAKTGMGLAGPMGAVLGGAGGYAYGQANSFADAMRSINSDADPIGAAAKAFGWADADLGDTQSASRENAAGGYFGGGYTGEGFTGVGGGGDTQSASDLGGYFGGGYTGEGFAGVGVGGYDASQDTSDTADNGGFGGDTQSDSNDSGSGFYMGGEVTADRLNGPNPVGPDDGSAPLDIGEFVLTADVARREGRDKLQALLEGRATIVMV